MTKLQNLFIALVNVDIFQITLNLVYSLLTNKCNFCWNIVSTFLSMQTRRMFADVCSVCTIWITFLKFSVNLKLHMDRLPTPDNKPFPFLPSNELSNQSSLKQKTMVVKTQLVITSFAYFTK